MAAIRFLNFYQKFNGILPDAGDTSFGNYLGYPGVALRKYLEKLNIHQVLHDDFDILVCIDLDHDIFDYAKSLPKEIKKILLIVESLEFCPMTRNAATVCDPVWNHVVSYNRELVAPKIFHYDIAVTGTQCSILPLTPLKDSSAKGVFIGKNKGEYIRANYMRRDSLITKLAEENEIAVYGPKWPDIPNYKGTSDNKLQSIANYRFSVVVENIKHYGYVTEKLPDSILAERPVLYYGDCVNARRRFGDTFVCLPDLTYQAFYEAKQTLFENYEYYYNNCIVEKKESEKWIESFITTMTNAIKNSLNY